jgi:hypothetical protein
MKDTKNIIKETKDYSLFQVYDFNRPINQGLVKRIMDSIQKIGFISSKPILVDKEFKILDGQHRFTACKNLKLPIYYSVIGGDAHEIVTNLNAQQVNWTMKDYIHAWSEKNVRCYKQLEEFEDKYKLGITNSLYIFFTSNQDNYDIKRIKEGKIYNINQKAKEIANFIEFCQSSGCPYYRSSLFVKAVVRLFKVINDDQLTKLKKYIISLPQQPTASAYLTSFENLVNRGVTSKNRVSFKTN